MERVYLDAFRGRLKAESSSILGIVSVTSCLGKDGIFDIGLVRNNMEIVYIYIYEEPQSFPHRWMSDPLYKWYWSCKLDWTGRENDEVVEQASCRNGTNKLLLLTHVADICFFAHHIKTFNVSGRQLVLDYLGEWLGAWKFIPVHLWVRIWGT